MRLNDQITVGERTYVIDVRRDGHAPHTPYELSITDDRDDGARLEGRVIAGELTSVASVVQRTMLGLAQLTGEIPPGESAEARERRRTRLQEVRKDFPNAGTPWSADEDARLLETFQSGGDLRPLAAELGRRPSALVSRLRTKGLIDMVESREILQRWRREAAPDPTATGSSIEPRFVATGPFT